MDSNEESASGPSRRMRVKDGLLVVVVPGVWLLILCRRVLLVALMGTS